MQIVCTTCQTPIPPAGVDLPRMLAKCRQCNAVMDISAFLEGPRPAAPTATAAPMLPTAPLPSMTSLATVPPRQRFRSFVGLPEGIRLLVDEQPVHSPGDYRHQPSSTAGALVIERRWFQPAKHLFAVFFLIVWFGILSLWYAKAGRSGSPLVLLFPLFHVGAGIAVAYSTLAGFLNKTRIGVRDGDFFIEHGPLPWRGNRRLPATRVQQLFVEEEFTKTRNGGVEQKVFLSAIVDGSRQRLLANLASVEQGLFLEQAVETRLGIVDVAVAGETPS